MTFLLGRYFAKDNWNILDTASILCVLIAFIFRLMAYAKELYTEDTIFNNAFTQQASIQVAACTRLSPYRKCPEHGSALSFRLILRMVQRRRKTQCNRVG